MTSVYSLNFRHLRAALAIAEKGSVSAAAAEINLSQPALTQGLARLEAQLDQRLFERRPDGMAATDAGLLLTERVAAASSHLAQAARAIRKGVAAGFARPEELVTMAQLRALIALARAGSFVTAGQATGLSQPALHRAIRDVERLCGIALVERRGRGVALTTAGLRLARGFRLAIGELVAATSELESLAGQDSGRVAIGAMPLARVRLLPLAVARFHRSHPTVEFAIAEGSHAELVEPLRDGELDMLIGALRDPSPGDDLVQESLFSNTLAIIARAGHPLAARARVRVRDLTGYPWALARKGTPLRAQWNGLFHDAGIVPPEVRIESGSVMLLRGLLLEGDFLTLLSTDQVAFELGAGLLVQIGRPLEGTVRSIGLTTRANWRPTPTQSRFIGLVRSLARDIGIPDSE